MRAVDFLDDGGDRTVRQSITIRNVVGEKVSFSRGQIVVVNEITKTGTVIVSSGKMRQELPPQEFTRLSSLL